MPIIFTDKADDIFFSYQDNFPSDSMNLRVKGESPYRLNVAAFHLYGLYRNAVYDSYKQKSDLAKDIREYKKVFHEEKESKLSAEPLYHYAVTASLGAMQEWKDSDSKMKAYIAYQEVDGHKKKVGFVHFIEKTVEGKPVVYIAQAGVSNPSQGVGRRLMECVLAHYPAETEFYILTRVFNTEAKNLYQKRFGFSPIEEKEITQLGYDSRYCGFKHTTSQKEVELIKNKQVEKTTIKHKQESKQMVTKHQSYQFSKSNFVRYGLFAATAVAFGAICYNIFSKGASPSSNSSQLPRPGL